MRDIHSAPPASSMMDAHAPVKFGEHLALSILWMGLNIQSAALLPIVIPTQLLLLVTAESAGAAEQATILGWLSAVGALAALVVLPLAGAASDRMTTSLGRRKPYIVIGAAGSLVGAYELATARDLIGFFTGFIVLQIASNVCTGAYQGLIPDRVPEAQRGEASGFMGLMTILGNGGSLVLAAVLLGGVTLDLADASIIRQGAATYYILTGILVALTALITLVGVREMAYPAPPASVPVRMSRNVLRLWTEPLRSPNFRWVFVTRGFVMLGLTLFLTFIEYYFADVAGITQFVQATAVIAALALGGALISALWLGIVSDRVPRIPLVAISTGCMALAALAFVLFPASIPLWPLGLLFGVGYGAYTSVDWALAVDVLPALETAGKDMGIWSIATNLPAVIAPLVGSLIIAAAARFGQLSLGYRLVFAVAALFLLLGAVCVRYIRLPEHEAPASSPTTERRHTSWIWRLARRTRAGTARGFLRFWPVWEWITHQLWRPVPIPGASAGLFEVRFRRHKGSGVDLPDGTSIMPGALIGELHMRNRVLVTLMTTRQPLEILRVMRDELSAIAAWTQRPDFPSDFVALYGMTLLGRAAPRLGFVVMPKRRTLHLWFDRFFMMGLMALYNSAGTDRLSRGTTYVTYPSDVWMSRRMLIERYGGQDKSAMPGNGT